MKRARPPTTTESCLILAPICPMSRKVSKTAEPAANPRTRLVPKRVMASETLRQGCLRPMAPEFTSRSSLEERPGSLVISRSTSATL